MGVSGKYANRANAKERRKGVLAQGLEWDVRLHRHLVLPVRAECGAVELGGLKNSSKNLKKRSRHF